MSNKNVDPTIAGLIISAIAALILRIRVKVKKKSPDKDVDVQVNFDKTSDNQLKQESND